MQKYLDETYEFNSHLKCDFVNNSTVCINRYYSWYPKEMINKISIVKYPSVPDSCDRCNVNREI